MTSNLRKYAASEPMHERTSFDRTELNEFVREHNRRIARARVKRDVVVLVAVVIACAGVYGGIAFLLGR